MSRYGTALVLALAACLVGPSLAVGQSSTELTVFVSRPTPPISTSDVIRLVAGTPNDVFPGGGEPYYSTSILIDGFEINWAILTSGFDAGGIPEAGPMIRNIKVGPLPAGTYNVTATWNHTGEGLLLNAPSSGIGYTSFTVVPEPSTLAMGLAGAITTVCLARRRRRSGHAPF